MLPLSQSTPLSGNKLFENEIWWNTLFGVDALLLQKILRTITLNRGLWHKDGSDCTPILPNNTAITLAPMCLITFWPWFGERNRSAQGFNIELELLPANYWIAALFPTPKIHDVPSHPAKLWMKDSWKYGSFPKTDLRPFMWYTVVCCGSWFIRP